MSAVTYLKWGPPKKVVQWTGIVTPDAVAITVKKQEVESTSNSLAIDATITRSTAFNVEITDHSLESGSHITDHISPKPETIELDTILIDDINSPMGSLSVPQGKAYENFRKLQELAISGTLFSIESPTFVDSDLAIESIQTSKDSDLKNGLSVKLMFRKIYYVDTVQIKVDAPPIKKEIKKAAPVEATPADAEQSRSFYLKGFDQLTGGAKQSDAFFKTFGTVQ